MDKYNKFFGEERPLLIHQLRKQQVELEKLRQKLCERPYKLSNSIVDEQYKAFLQEGAKSFMEGYFHKKDSRTATWQKYYFVFNPSSLELMYWKTKEDQSKGKGTSILVSWVFNEPATEEDMVPNQLRLPLPFGRSKNVCTLRMSVYCSANRVYMLCAQSDDEANKWFNTIDRLLRMIYIDAELSFKIEHASKLLPVQKKQLQLEREQYKHIVSKLQTAGLFPDRPSIKIREGYLEMEKADGTWKRYYFILFTESLSYFNVDDKTMLPRGVILIDSITTIKISSDSSDTDKMEVEDAMEIDTSQGFVIDTVLRSFYLRAKHSEAAKDWINLIYHQRNDLIPDDEHKRPDPSLVQPVNPIPTTTINVNSTKTLQYVEAGKSKTVKILSKGQDSIIVGRSSKADVSLLDTKVSRNHFKIENQNNSITLTDLGSNSGTLVNGKKVISTPLRNGDRIQIGTTIINFTAV